MKPVAQRQIHNKLEIHYSHF